MEISSSFFPKGSDLCFLLQGAGCQSRGCRIGVMFPFFSKCVSRCRESYKLSHSYTDPLQDKVDELRVGNKVCSSSTLHASEIQLATSYPISFLFPLSRVLLFLWVCFVWGFDYFILFYSQLSVYAQIQKKVGPLCPSPASRPSAPGALFRNMD